MFVPFVVAFALGLFARRGRGWIALAGIVLALVWWLVVALAGGFEDDPEGTSALLSLVFAVPAYAALWAAAVGAGYLVSRLRGRATPDSRS